MNINEKLSQLEAFQLLYEFKSDNNLDLKQFVFLIINYDKIYKFLIKRNSI